MDESSNEQSGTHKPSGRWRLGLLLALATVLLWSTVPIALSLLLTDMDAVTITWYRFLAATLVLAAFLRSRGTLSRLGRLKTRRSLRLLAVAAIGLMGSFILYISSLKFIPPGASAVVYQLSTYFMLFGGVVLFRESFRREQWFGLGAITLGLGLFFNQRLSMFVGHATDYLFGVLLVVFASIVWASYALAQKQLLSICSSAQIMFLLYALGVVMMFPLTSLSQIRRLSTLQYLVLAYASTNALLAYACFAEALQHWEASRVSAMMATVPLLTLGMSTAAHRIWPDQIKPEQLNLLALFGAVLVVVGSMLAALGGRRPDDAEP
jgi:drug/metabolite transporter (DMT)-like permease